jgi:uncharacterized membrane protein HdeD (DUF308 family)
MIRPLIIVLVAGAMVVYYYFMDHLRNRGGWKTVLANIVSLIGYLIALWLALYWDWTARCGIKRQSFTT